MESNATELLKDAVYEENEDIRLTKISKACKKISEILPFEKKRHVILEQTELITYFFLCVPLFGHSIDLLMKSMLECFESNEIFILNFWRGIEYIAKNLIEKKSSKPKLNNASGDRRSTIMIGSVFENQKNSMFQMDFCSAIIQNKGKIKNQVLFFANRIMLMLFENPHQNIIPNKISVLEFFLSFLRNTNQENIIIKTCLMIRDWKEKWPQLWHRSDFDIALEEILLQKQDLNHKFDMVSEQASPFLPHMSLGNLAKTNISSENINLGEDENKTVESSSKKTHLDVQPVKIILSSVEEILGPDEWKELNQGEEKFAEDDDENKNVLIIQIENWLCTDEDPPLIGKNEYISHFFKIHENFKSLLALILDPLCNSPSNCWVKKYPKILKESDECNSYKELLEDNLAFRKKDYQPMKYSKFFNIINLRSYKTLKMICDIRNYRHIYKANNNIIETYFGCLYTVLQKDDGSINMNHVAKLTEYFIKRNQDLSINLLFNYNILFKFMQYISFPHVRDFILYFVGNFYHQTRLSIKNQNKLWRYLHNSHFFQDMAKIMFHGSLAKLDSNKSSDLYKAIDIEINVGTHETMADEQKETDPYNPNTHGLTADSHTILEEFTGFRTDIDRLKGRLQVQSHVFEAKKLSNELMVIRSFKIANNKLLDVGKKEPQEVDFGLGLAKKFIKKLETVRLTEYIEIPKPKEVQVKNSSESPLKSPNRSPLKNQSVLITRPPVGLSLSKKLISIKDSKNSSNRNSFLKSGTIPSFSPKNSKNGSPLRPNDKKTLTAIRKITSGTEGISPFSATRGYLMGGKENHMKQGDNSKAPHNPHNLTWDITLESNDKSNQLIKLEKSMESPQIEAKPNPKPKEIQLEPIQNNKTTLLNEAKNLQVTLKPVGRNPSLRDLGSAALKHPSMRDLESPHNKLQPAIKGPSIRDFGLFSNSKLPPPAPIEKIRKNLYPLNFKDLEESKLEAKAKAKKFSNEFIEKTDKLISLHAAEILSQILKNAIENYDYPIMKKIIELSGKDYSLLFSAMFQPEEALFFSTIFENYLLKIKVNRQNPINSAFICGETVNLVISRLPNFILKSYFVPMHNVCQACFPYLCKVIIDSYTWEPIGDQEIKIQTLIVDDLLLSARLLLVNTFYLILRNDKDSNTKLMDTVPDACWHAMLTWFFEKKHNNMYQRLFMNILETCLKQASETFLLKILVKLNLIGSIYDSLGQVYRNEVPYLKLPCESYFFYIDKIICLIDSLLQNMAENKGFCKQIQGLSSWRNIMKIIHKHFKPQKFLASPPKLTGKTKYPESANSIFPNYQSNKTQQKLPDKKKHFSMLSSDNSFVKQENPYKKIIEEKQRKSKLLKTGSGDEDRIHKSRFGTIPRNNQEARTLTDISDGMFLPQLMAKKKKKSSGDNLDNLSQYSQQKI